MALGAAATVTALATSAIGITNGAVTFDAADTTALDAGVSNGIGNLWAGFTFILPYVGLFLGLSLVIGIVMSKMSRGR